jgi:hypothetical protein
VWFERPVPDRYRPESVPAPANLPTDTQVKRLTSNGGFTLDKVAYMVDGGRAYQPVLVITAGDRLIVTDLQGEILIEHTRPPAGVRYVGNGRPPGGPHRNPEVSPKS